VLLLRPRSAPEPAGPTRELTCAFEPPSGLAAWRARVRSDPREFLQLCAHLDCTPNIWALHDWSGWVTPFARSSPGRRFDTTFYLCCLCQPPPVDPDNAEVVDSQVGHPRAMSWDRRDVRRGTRPWPAVQGRSGTASVGWIQ
jgi:nucleoside diphosphate-linked moiety X motif protein 19